MQVSIRPCIRQPRSPYYYDVTLQWLTDPDSSEPAILTAMQEQLGLKLAPQLMLKESPVMDHVEMPAAD
jgi:uncharacterized protein (TIGR03435 family)